MASLATFNFKLAQLYPGTGAFRLNTCGNPDCSNYGHTLTERPGRRAEWSARRPDFTPEQLKFAERRGPGAYKLAGAEPRHRRTSSVFEYETNPHEWSDQRTVRCLGLTSDGSDCNFGFSILSPDHLDEEIARLRHHNGILEGPCCGACGARFLDDPDQFALDGVHERSKDRTGQAINRKKTPTSLRILHKPCKGKKGARFSVSLPHAGQKTTSDNLRILAAVLNSAGIVDIQRMIGTAATGKKIGISRIYDRISWLEEVFLAYEREMLRRWKERAERSDEYIEHLLSHDDMVLTVNWETATDRRNTQLNCSITADARSGYVYRLDVDFDPRAKPLDLFNQTYLDEDWIPQNIRHHYLGGQIPTAPKFSWQRPTGRYHEKQFFAACVNELKAFQTRAKRRMPRSDGAPGKEVILKAEGMIDAIRTISEGWFGFPVDTADSRGSFKGMTTRDIYTKGAHFALLKEMLPQGQIVLTTEQEATLPPLLTHIFHDEICENRFAWLILSFNKKATKPEKLRKVKGYRQAHRGFHQNGLFDGKFDANTDIQTVTEAFIADKMTKATREGSSPFQIASYQSSAFPDLWVRSPTQASGELDKVVGFPVLLRHLRRRLKRIPNDENGIDPDLRDELAPWVYKATLQPVSTFMNSLRQRLSAADRTSAGGARIGGSYIQGAVFNPKTLISLLNIYRVYYNFFEPRPYACPFSAIDDMIDPQVKSPRSIRIPGTHEFVELAPKARRTPNRITPAMRHGMDALTRRKDDSIDPPDIYRMPYRPWLFMGTKLGARFERSGPRVRPASAEDGSSAAQASEEVTETTEIIWS